MRIGIDVDGVLARFEDGFSQLLIEVTGENLLPTPDNRGRFFGAVGPTVWDWPEQFGYTSEQVAQTWDKVKSNQVFWERLRPFDASLKLDLLSGAHDVYYITQRVGVRAKEQTENWLIRVHDVMVPTVLITGEKGLAAKALGLDIYVDDNGDNILSTQRESPATLAVLVTKAYNMEYEVKTRAAGLRSALALRGIRV